MTSSDAAILAGVRAADPGAKWELFQQHANGLYDYAFSLLRRESEATEVLVASFATAVERFKRLDDPNKIRSTLYAITRTNCLEVLNRRDADDSENDLDLLAMSSAPQATEAELRDLAWGAITHLPERDQSVLNLHLRSKLTDAELGAVVGVTPDNVRETISQAESDTNKSAAAALALRIGRTTCPDLFMISLDGYGRLTPEVHDQIVTHIETCDDCHRTLSQLPTAWDMLRDIGLREAPATAAEQLFPEPEPVEVVDEDEAEPAITESAITEPAAAEPSAAKPSAAKPAITEPVDETKAGSIAAGSTAAAGIAGAAGIAAAAGTAAAKSKKKKNKTPKAAPEPEVVGGEPTDAEPTERLGLRPTPEPAVIASPTANQARLKEAFSEPPVRAKPALVGAAPRPTKSGSKGKVALIAVGVAALLGLGGYAVYATVLDTETSTTPPKADLSAGSSDKVAPEISRQSLAVDRLVAGPCPGEPKQSAVDADVTDNAIKSVHVSWTDARSHTETVALTRAGDHWYGTLGPFAIGGDVRWEVAAIDQAGNRRVGTPGHLTVQGCAATETTSSSPSPTTTAAASTPAPAPAPEPPAPAPAPPPPLIELPQIPLPQIPVPQIPIPGPRR